MVAFGAGRLVMKLVHAQTTGYKTQVEVLVHNACKSSRLPKGDITVEIVDISFAVGKSFLLLLETLCIFKQGINYFYLIFGKDMKNCFQIIDVLVWSEVFL